MRCGMMAWMEAWSGCSPQYGVNDEGGWREDASHHANGEQPMALPDGLHGQVAELLAGIACAMVRS